MALHYRSLSMKDGLLWWRGGLLFELLSTTYGLLWGIVADSGAHDLQSCPCQSGNTI